MPSVGQQIREQRLRLGLKLEEVSARSRIPFKTLQALESDDLKRLSSPFLYRSFVRQFAEQVKLDYLLLAPDVEAAALTMPQPRMPGEGELGRTRVAPLPLKGRTRNFRWLYSIASLAFVLVACSSLYGVWQTSKSTWLSGLNGKLRPTDSRAVKGPVAPSSDPHSPALQSSAVVPLEAPGAKPSRRAIQALPHEPTPTAADSDSGVSTARASPEFRVELSAIERTWLSIVEDGKQTFSGVLAAEETKVLEGHDTARIHTGNAGGISCVFNGKSIGPLGPRGQVRTVVFTKSNYEVLETPAHIAMMHFPSIAE